jgi:hypothetical protein
MSDAHPSPITRMNCAGPDSLSSPNWGPGGQYPNALRGLINNIQEMTEEGGVRLTRDQAFSVEILKELYHNLRHMNDLQEVVEYRENLGWALKQIEKIHIPPEVREEMMPPSNEQCVARIRGTLQLEPHHEALLGHRAQELKLFRPGVYMHSNDYGTPGGH